MLTIFLKLLSLKNHIFDKNLHYTKNETSIKDFFSKSDQIQWKLRIWLHLRKKKYLANGKLHFLFSVGSFARKQITR